MSLAVTPSTKGRAVPRIPTARPATLRNAQRQPIDIFLENLSVDGFGMTTATDLPRGARVSLQLGGVGPRDALVVRRLGLSYGCEFIEPLDGLDLAAALASDAVVGGYFGAEHRPRLNRNDSRVSPRGSIAVLLSVNLLLWTTIIGAVHILLT